MEQEAINENINSSTPFFQNISQPPITIRTARLPVVRCPSDRLEQQPNPGYAPTNYVACIGRGEGPDRSPTISTRNIEAVLPLIHIHDVRGSTGSASTTSIASSLARDNNQKPVRVNQILDGTANTMVVSECLVNEPWIKRYGGDTAGYNNCKLGTANVMNRNEDDSGNNYLQGRGYSWVYAIDNQAWTYSTHFRPNDSLTRRQKHECHQWSTTGVMAARSRHPGIVLVMLADGSVRSIRESISTNTWHALGSRQGGEALPDF
jgi:hypothetical protein